MGGITTRYAQEISTVKGLDGVDGADGVDGSDGEVVGVDIFDVPVAPDGSVVLDLSRGSMFRILLTMDVVISILAGTEGNGLKFSLSLTQNGVGGWDATLWAPIRWSRGGTPPVLTPTANKRDTFGFEVWNNDVTISYDGFVIGQDI